MIVTVTWDQVETRQADIDMADDTPPEEITALAIRAATVRAAPYTRIQKVGWECEETRTFGGRYG